MTKCAKRIILALIICGILGTGACCFIYFHFSRQVTNRRAYECVGDIPAPAGYKRITGSDPAFSDFLRALPLRPKGSRVTYYTGGTSDYSTAVSYAILDLALLSNDEQCADCCMRLRGEYLYQSGQYAKISFKDVNGNAIRYRGGQS